MPNVHKIEDLGSLVQKSKMPTKPILQLTQLKPQSPQLQLNKTPTPKIKSPDLSSNVQQKANSPNGLDNEVQNKIRVQKVRKTLAPAPLGLKRAQELIPLKEVRRVKPVIQHSEELGMI
ncbi:Hypothetical_protein [Hexamita inflata]|uniref:Hypothetical_protein n=1 Tax=Hexamita inflata TaxID=28002 RepID=A0AA86U4Z0_9EUKA|nr:Hypothetical protein HINF_LOCUS18378 [Hexamita inflata]